MDYAVIMAGGTGKRLWPLSRQKRPKQVLKLFEGQTLLRKCFDRLLRVFEPERIFVLTNAAYADIVRENLPEVPARQVIAEPAVRDTAGAIGLAAAVLDKTDPDAAMAVVTADQIIEPVETFAQAMKDSLAFINANPKSIVTFGIEPTFPSTQLGYIKLMESRKYPGCKNPVSGVDSFREKPDIENARKYLDKGNYCWNSGMFVWKAKTVLNYLDRFLPESTEPLRHIGNAWATDRQNSVFNEWFLKMPRISIDYAVMEKADDVYAIRLNCRWLDMGSFGALGDIVKADSSNNIITAASNSIMDSDGNIIITEDDGHMIALIGVKDMVVAHSHDATLVCPKDQTEKLKALLDQIEKQGKGHYL